MRMCLVALPARSRAEEWHDVQVLVREHAEHNTVVATFTDTRKLSFACNWASHLTSIGVGGLIVQSGLKLSGSRGSSSAEEGSNMAWRCADAPAHAPTGGSSQPTCRHGHDSRGAHSTCSGGAGEIFWFEVAATQVWEGTKTEQISFAGITHDRKAS